ncbi:ABC transporter ATP-binding protein [Microbacterium gilvum]|uniref:ABC transporter ATP-binding protein n=1 Tax=Microbacterium gilvum TaxID=1336204 RepID=A0ABP9A526_9MICO
MSAEHVLSVEDLAVRYRTRRGAVDAVRGVSLNVASGETVALVGESGSGKSTTAHAVVRLLPPAAQIVAGRVIVGGADLVRAGERDLRRLRGRAVGLVPQDPTVSLNPVTRIGDQVAEVLRIHRFAAPADAHRLAVDALGAAGVPQPAVRARQYPHELSGGMRQRVLIAIATIAKPALLIADEPTSALDVTVQRRILDQLDALRAERGTSILLITHDLGVAGDRADRIVVMRGGRVVEEGTPDAVLGAPSDPYTQELIAAAPSLGARGVYIDARRTAERPTGAAEPVLSVAGLVKDFALPGGRRQRAVDDVSFSLGRARTLAVVGESGSGKTTTARLALRLVDPTEGSVALDGEDLTSASGARLRELRRRVQLVQQNPYAALNPRLSVEELVADPLHALGIGSRAQRRRRVEELVDLVALPSGLLARRPAELSGGQRQRVAIARALAPAPEVVVLDEPVSALDVSVQHQILTLLSDLQRELGLSYLFISHDLAVVRRIAHEVVVMRRGRIVESGAIDDVFDRPGHAYTRALLDAIPGRRAAAPSAPTR